MLLEDFSMPRAMVVRERSFDQFWTNSRFRGVAAGINVKPHVKEALDEMMNTGGFYTCLECEMDGRSAGSLVVFRDPRYRSKRREDVACFGFVTAHDAPVLSALLDEAMKVARKQGCSALRGPVNVPRHFFGYGVLVSGYDKPVIAGTPANGEADAAPFLELDSDGYFDACDRYYNVSQDFDKTLAYMATLGLDTSFRIVNPDLDHLGDMPAQVAGLMNDTLGYRADYTETDPARLAAQAKAFKAVPGGEKLMAFYYDGDVLAGGVLMHPDWFQVLRGEAATTVIGDIYMLAPAYQGRRLLLNFSEYSLRVLKERGTTFYEHASIHEGTTSIMATVKRGLTSIVREARVFELET